MDNNNHIQETYSEYCERTGLAKDGVYRNAVWAAKEMLKDKFHKDAKGKGNNDRHQ